MKTKEGWACRGSRTCPAVNLFRCGVARLATGLALAAGLLAGTAMADLITPTDVGGTMGQERGSRGPIHAIDNSGIGAPQVGGYDTHQRTGDNVQWLSASGKMPGSMTYDLGAVYNLTDMVLWNYDENNTLTNRGIKEFSIKYYDKTNGLITSAGPYTAQYAIFSGGRVVAEVIDIADVNNVNKIKLVGITNFGGDTVVGMCELKFLGSYVEPWVNYTPSELISPTGGVTDMGQLSSIRGLSNSWNTSGLTPAAPPLWSTNTHGSGNADNIMWESANGITVGSVTYVMASNLEVRALALWAFNEQGNATICIKDFDVVFINKKDVEISSITGLQARNNGDFAYELEKFTGGSVLHGGLQARAGTVAEVFTFSPVADVKKIRLNITSNWGATVTGISEIGICGRGLPPRGAVIVIR